MGLIMLGTEVFPFWASPHRVLVTPFTVLTMCFTRLMQHPHGGGNVIVFLLDGEKSVLISHFRLILLLTLSSDGVSLAFCGL